MGEMKDIHDTAKRILTNAMLAAADPVRAVTMTFGERKDALLPLQRSIDAHMQMLAECLEQASLAGANSVHAALHQSPAVDPEMLDQAVEYAPGADEEAGEDG